MLKAKEMNVGIKEVEIVICPVEVREEVKEEAPPSLVVDPSYVASSSGSIK